MPDWESRFLIIVWIFGALRMAALANPFLPIDVLDSTILKPIQIASTAVSSSPLTKMLDQLLHNNILENALKEATQVDPTSVSAPFSHILGDKPAEKVCYGKLGCFSSEFPWHSPLRPLPLPMDPKNISATVTLFTRKSSGGFSQSLYSEEFRVENSNYDSNRPETVFITHGFASNGQSEWLQTIKDAYLQNVDANVFIVDWGKGASYLNYLQVASNTRIEGALLTRFLRYLIGKGLSPKNVHLIGHSLGAHVMAYCAKNISEIAKINRITALDPAQPGFEGNPKQVRLDSNDAENVDVIHTDAKPFIPFFGFGMLSPTGTVDFYMNGGSMQPGCLSLPTPNITSITDLAQYPVEVISKWVSCSHSRSYEYFISSLLPKNCSLWGRKMSYTENFLQAGTLGRLSLADPIVNALSKCTVETCTTIGMDTFKLPARGLFSVTTKSDFPYCETSEEEEAHLKNLLTLGLYNYLPKIGPQTLAKTPLKFLKIG